MNKILISIISMSALLLLSACTQDGPGGQGNELPYGEYPLQIGGVTLDVESSAKPWSVEEPQTRVAEDKNDGKSSAWEWNGTERIGVQIVGDRESGVYVLNSVNNNNIVEAEAPCYWTSTDPADIIAWYPLEETVSLQDQSDGLAYVLQAAESAAYNQTVNLSFNHQLAKVRVVLNGAGAEQVTNVEVYNYTQCTHNMGTVSADDGNKGWIKMAHLTYIDGTECWEANVVPGVGIDKNNFIRLSGLVVLIEDNLSGFTHTTLSAGEMYTINLTVDGTSL